MMVPEGWAKCTLGDVIGIKNGFAFKSSFFVEDGPYKLMTPGHFYEEGGFRDIGPKQKYYDGPIPDGFVLKKGDMLIALTEQAPGLLASSAIIPEDGSFLHNQRLGLISISNCNAYKGFLYHLFNHRDVRKEVSASAGGTKVKHTSSAKIYAVSIVLPPIVEQEAIATILTAWDRAIDKAEALIKAKEQRKTGLMQRLLTGKVRFGEFAGETWKEMSIGKLLRQVKRPVVWDDDAWYKLLSLRRASGGLFHRQTLRGSEILTKKMNTALEGDFLISKMQVVHGATGLTTAEFDGYHVSDSYLAYVARDPSTLDIRFFNWLCKTKQMYHKAYRSSYGVHIEKMTFNPKLWLKETIMLPPTTDEQAKIVEVLDTSVAEIEEHRTQLAALKDQKKGLMRQLLTGKVRVKAKE